MKINQNKLYKFMGFWWSMNPYSGNIDVDDIEGPYCLNCQVDLQFPDSAYTGEVDYDGEPVLNNKWRGNAVCFHCNRTFKITEPIIILKQKVLLALVVSKRAEIPKVSLEDPPTQLKVRDEDNIYFLAAKIGEKDGKRVGVVYFGEKNKDQKKEDYSQIFIDLDDEQIRFDKSNRHPKEILAKFQADFKNTLTTSRFSKKK